MSFFLQAKFSKTKWFSLSALKREEMTASMVPRGGGRSTVGQVGIATWQQLSVPRTPNPDVQRGDGWEQRLQKQQNPVAEEFGQFPRRKARCLAGKLLASRVTPRLPCLSSAASPWQACFTLGSHRFFHRNVMRPFSVGPLVRSFLCLESLLLNCSPAQLSWCS